jgi:MacB-like periplasmic core domain
MTHLVRRWLDAILLDSRLGVRMLLKHRGLTVVGAFAMAVAIAVGATTFAAVAAVLDPALPFPGGGRVVSLTFVRPDAGSPERQVIHEFAALRINSSPWSTSARFAMRDTTSSLPADESESATPVVVIGHEAWQLRLGGDRNVVGRTINLGGIPRTVVGVMPKGFKFPFPSRVLDSTARGSAQVQAWGRTGDLHVRSSCAWRHDRSSKGGVRYRRVTERRGTSREWAAASAGGRSLHARPPGRGGGVGVARGSDPRWRPDLCDCD